MIQTPVILLVLSCSIVFGITSQSDQHDQIMMDKTVQSEVGNFAAKIDSEKLFMESTNPSYGVPVDKDKEYEIPSFQVIIDAEKEYKDRKKGKIQYFTYPVTENGQYCALVKHAGGDIARSQGYAYSSETRKVAPLDESDCVPDKFVRVAGVKNPINEHNNPEFSETPGPFLAGSLIVGAGYFFRWKRRQSGARPIFSHDRVPPEALALDSARREELERYMETLIIYWLEYETDPVYVLEYPMVSNMGFEPTANFHFAMTAAKQAFQNKSSTETLEQAVARLEHAYKVMIFEAQRMKWSSFTNAERSHLAKAQRLLNIAMDLSSSPNERKIAYKRLLREVEGIITLSPEAVFELESRATLQLED